MQIKPTHEAADAFWKYWKENGETHKHGYYESTWGAINAALAVSAPESPAKEQPGEQRWIPVSERLPENFQVVRIRTHEGSELPATCFDATFRVDDQAYGIRWLNKNRITHWRALPPPPERP